MSRKSEKWLNEQISREESDKLKLTPVAADIIAEAEARHVAEMLNPDTVPEWARPASHGRYMPAGTEARLTQLTFEETEAKAKLEAATKAREEIEAARVEQIRLDEENAVAARELPNRLKATLQAVQSFVPAGEKPAPVTADTLIQRNIDALARAQRRARGEQIEEPVYNDFQIESTAPTSAQDALRARVAGDLARAALMQKELAAWSTAVGSQIDSLYVPAGEADRPMIESLMRGLPPTQPNLSLVLGLIASVRSIVVARTMAEAVLTRELATIERVVTTIDRRGPLTVQNDHSTAYYDVERELKTALLALATVNEDSLRGLWLSTKDVLRRLEAIEAIRQQHEGQPVEELKWQNKGDIVYSALEAQDRKDRARTDKSFEQSAADAPSVKLGGERHRPTQAPSWSPFDGGR